MPSPLRSAARLQKILTVFARHGFQDLIERVKLGRFFVEKVLSKDLEHLSTAERLRLSFEQLGPTFVKLGQLLAARSDLLPEEYIEEFKKLHDNVMPLTHEELKGVLQEHFPNGVEDAFASFDDEPLAAASIAQVHRATLKTGERVVVKIQRPGIGRIIREDLDILRMLAELVEKYIAEARFFNPTGVIAEFKKQFEMEMNFVVEANNIRRFAHNFRSEPNIKIPVVYTDLTNPKILVMEALEGIPLSQKASLEQEGIERELLIRRGLKAYFKMVYTDGLFHGDLHAGNILVLPNNQIGMIDFGVVGRLNKKTQSAIAAMFVALAEEDYDRLAYLYVELAPYTDAVDVDEFAKDIRDLIAPYFGLSIRHVNLGKILLQSTSLAVKHGLVLPSDLVLFFKSIVTIEGMGRLILKDFDLLAISMEFAQELVEAKAEPAKWIKETGWVMRDVNSVLTAFPRQFKQLMRKVNSPDFALKIQATQMSELQCSIEQAGRMVFWGLVLSGALIAGAILFVKNT